MDSGEKRPRSDFHQPCFCATPYFPTKSKSIIGRGFYLPRGISKCIFHAHRGYRGEAAEVKIHSMAIAAMPEACIPAAREGISDYMIILFFLYSLINASIMSPLGQWMVFLGQLKTGIFPFCSCRTARASLGEEKLRSLLIGTAIAQGFWAIHMGHYPLLDTVIL